MRFCSTIDVILGGGRVECETCHTCWYISLSSNIYFANFNNGDWIIDPLHVQREAEYPDPSFVSLQKIKCDIGWRAAQIQDYMLLCKRHLVIIEQTLKHESITGMTPPLAAVSTIQRQIDSVRDDLISTDKFAGEIFSAI
jgi:hypothetical protein